MSLEHRTCLSQASELCPSGPAAALRRTTIDRSNTLFTDVLGNDLLHNAIFSFCSPKTLLRLSRVCRAAHVAVRVYFHRAFDINLHLSRFFDDPVSFRTLQARTGTLISGSMALQFLDRSFYPESDLDIYVHMQRRHEVGRWLMDAGYIFSPNPSQDSDLEIAMNRCRASREVAGVYWFARGMVEVFTFYKAVHGGGQDRKIQLMVAAKTPIEIILCFHSTCVMNIISYKKAVALYPEATFEQRLSLICETDGLPQEAALAKYKSRGWGLVRQMPHVGGIFCVGSRWLEDKNSWVLPLDTIDILPPPSTSQNSSPLTDDPVVFTSWSLSRRRRGGGSMKYSYFDATSVVPLLRSMLFYNYIIDKNNWGLCCAFDDDAMMLAEVCSARDRPEVIYLDATLLSAGTAFLKSQQNTQT